MKIAFDVDVLAKQMSITDMVHKVADWGYKYIEQSPHPAAASALLDETGEVAREEHVGQQIADDRRDGHADQARHHETVVEQVFADDRGA